MGILAARIIAGIENPADVCVISSRPYGTRAVLKFAQATGATPIAGRFTPGTFTNQIQKAFREPRLLVATDPQFDHQAITEASYVNLPVIALCNTDSPSKYIDIAVPCNNKGVQSIGTMWWMLAREVLYLRGIISRKTPWDVMPDVPAPVTADWSEKPATGASPDWGAEVVAGTTHEPASKDWGAEPMPSAKPADDWGASTVVTTADWGAQPTGTTSDWGAADASAGWDY